ncbi:uncharacterized protein TRIADDRAFT_9217, partial [Trichoplax adhaerens]
IHLGRLTRNATKDHVQEIFSNYGKVKNVDVPTDRANGLPRGFAYIEFENGKSAENAIKYMNGGQIDGQAVTVAL